MKVFWLQIIDLDLFFRYLKRSCHGYQFAEKGKLPSFVALALRNGMGYRYHNAHINSVNNASISCKKFRELWSSNCNSIVDRTNLWTSGTTRQKTGVWRVKISPDILDRYSQSFHHMKALMGADDQSVPYFPSCQGTLLWQPNNFGRNEKVINANWYHLYSLH